jgi:general secretion pathway protein N
MLPRLDARGWLLVTIAGWAVLCAVAALSGFGGRYELLADDPKLVQPLPNAPAMNARSQMGPLEAYAEAANRPLFYPDRKPMAPHLAGQAASAQALNVVLTSVIMTPTLQMAIVQDPQTKESMRVREGKSLGGSYSDWKLVSLSPREAVFEGGSQGQMTLALRVFDGNGGEEPTRTGLTPQVIGSAGFDPPRQAGNPVVNVDPSQQAQPDPNGNANAAQAANMAAEAAQQAEQIRQRIQQRRAEAQAQAQAQGQGQGDNTPPPNDKR